MRKLFALLLVGGLFSFFACGERGFTEDDITETWEKGIEYGKQEIRDSIANLFVIEAPEKKVVEQIKYYGSDFGLPSGRVVDFSPADNAINNMIQAGGTKEDRQIYYSYTRWKWSKDNS